MPAKTMPDVTAYAWRDGTIGFDPVAPMGTLSIATGPLGPLNDVITAVARHAYDGETLLVPGIPEAEDDDAALEAFTAFRERVLARLG